MDGDTLDLLIAKVARMISVGLEKEDMRSVLFPLCKSEDVYFLVRQAAKLLAPLVAVHSSYIRDLGQEEPPPTVKLQVGSKI